MKTETERKCPNCKKNNLDRGMWFWICIHCHFSESIETGRIDNHGKPLRLKSLPNNKDGQQKCSISTPRASKATKPLPKKAC
jgi:hypothetical protein